MIGIDNSNGYKDRAVVEKIGNNYKEEIVFVGIGGAGCNVIINALEYGLPGEKVAINTDIKSLSRVEEIARGKKREVKTFLLGDGKGAGKDVKIAKDKYKESIIGNVLVKEKIIDYLKNFDIIVTFCGLGKGTGSGVTPELLKDLQKIKKEKNIGIISVVIYPHQHEIGQKDLIVVEEALKEIKSYVPVIILDNNNVFKKYKYMDLLEIYKELDKYVIKVWKAIYFITQKKAYKQIDVSDVKNFLKEPSEIFMFYSEIDNSYFEEIDNSKNGGKDKIDIIKNKLEEDMRNFKSIHKNKIDPETNIEDLRVLRIIGGMTRNMFEEFDYIFKKVIFDLDSIEEAKKLGNFGERFDGYRDSVGDKTIVVYLVAYKKDQDKFDTSITSNRENEESEDSLSPIDREKKKNISKEEKTWVL